MEYIKVPISYTRNNVTEIKREIEDRTSMIDNLIELIVFTPRGSFPADADFGFEYWNNEYSNVNFRDFNNGQNGAFVNGLYNEITRKECQESIRRCIDRTAACRSRTEKAYSIEISGGGEGDRNVGGGVGYIYSLWKGN